MNKTLLCGGARGQTPRLQQDQFLPGDPGLIKERERHSCGFSRARLSGHQRVPSGCQRLTQRRDRLFYW